MSAVSLIGQRFGRLVVLAKVQDAKGRSAMQCRCDCGAERVVRLSLLQSGNTRSCGCLKRDQLAARNTKHGRSKAPEYVIWIAMLQRCSNPKNDDYALYGGRGIVVCERWRASFAAFIEDMGERPARHSIDRIDPNGPYAPENCRWATATTQARNTRRNRVIEHGDERLTLIEWSLRVGVAHELIRARIDRLGWTVERALTTPARKNSRSRERTAA